MDDVLGDGVRRGGLGAENGGEGCGGQVTGLDLKVLVDQVQEVQLLPFVLVEPLGLDGEEAVRVQGDALGVVQPLGQGSFVVLLDPGQLVEDFFVRCEVSQFL